MSEEKRKFQRLALEALDVFIFDHERAGQLICTAKDISPGGLMVEAVSVLDPLVVKQGSRVVVEQCPSCLEPVLQGKEGAVCWGAGALLGLEFPELANLSDVPLAQFLEEHDMLPWSDWAEEEQ
jgi:hypothetical protein